LFGVEAQGDWADLSNTRVSPFFDRGIFATGLASTRTTTDGIGLFTGQVGYAWNAALFYVKGGAAVTSNRFSVLGTFTGMELASVSATRWGGTAGVGFEYGFSPNWSFGVEYNHLWMGDANNSFSLPGPVVAGVFNNRVTQDVDMVTLRLNYKFGGYGYGGAPARY
jgi:outer membrane immunogenic protein